MDFDALSGVGLAFGGLDTVVRVDKSPRANRQEPIALGVLLSPYWKVFVRDIYKSSLPHRFDVIEVLLNQDPRNLYQLERRIRRWRGGGTGLKNRDTAMVHINLGKRTFLIGVHFAKRGMSEDEWLGLSRTITYLQGRQRIGATDCFTILVMKKSRESFDAITFHRYVDPEDKIIEIIGGEASFRDLAWFGLEADPQ